MDVETFIKETGAECVANRVILKAREAKENVVVASIVNGSYEFTVEGGELADLLDKELKSTAAKKASKTPTTSAKKRNSKD